MSFIGSFVRAGLTTTARATEVALSLPRIAIALERVADAADDLRTLAAAADQARLALEAVSEEDIAAARATLPALLEAVRQLNGVVSSLNTTISPLQGATDRLGRLVDRLPQGRRRVIDSPSGPYG